MEEDSHKEKRKKMETQTSHIALTSFPVDILLNIVGILSRSSDSKRQLAKLRLVNKSFKRYATEIVMENLFARAYDSLASTVEKYELREQQVQDINSQLDFVSKRVEQKKECLAILKNFQHATDANSQKKLDALCDLDPELRLLINIIKEIGRLVSL